MITLIGKSLANEGLEFVLKVLLVNVKVVDLNHHV